MQNFKKLKIYISKTNSIYSNLATERYLYKSLTTTPILFFYQNDKSVIIGRNQNQFKEVKISELKNRDIDLCRRYSGGGAVYQDLGNLCFSFITPIFDKNILPLDMKEKHNEILIKGLNNLKIEAKAEGRNDLVLGDKKFSGSAFELDLGGKNGIKKVLHHGTLLLNTDFDVMKKILNPNILKLKSKGIDSVKARVVNLKTIFPDLKINDIIENVKKEFLEYFGKKNNFETEINFVDEKYISEHKEIKNYLDQLKNENWILSKCPEFTNNFETRFSWGIIDLFLEVKKGKIVNCKLYSDSLFPNFIDKIEEIIKNSDFEYCEATKGDIEELLLDSFKEENLRDFSKQFCEWFGECVRG